MARLFVMGSLIALCAGWVVHTIRMADHAEILQQEIAAQSKHIQQLTDTNAKLHADHKTRQEKLQADLNKLSGDSECANHQLDWGKQ